MVTFIYKSTLRLICVAVLAWSAPIFAQLPDGLMIVAYDGNAWFPYIANSKNDSWTKIEEIKNPSGVTWHKKTNQFFIKGNDGKLYRYELGAKELKHLESFDNTNNTQLRAHDDGFDMVQLIDGKSSDTHIVSVNKEGKNRVVVRQTSAQFHPYRHGNKLYFANVSCRQECKPLIQEVWRKDLVTGNGKQLTLLNATSYLSSVDSSGQYGFISSNQKDYYHLARIDLKSGEIIWLTNGAATDSFPSIAQDGSLYFIRRTAIGSRLIRLEKQTAFGQSITPEGALEILKLPDEIEKIRYLEISN